MLKKVAPMAGPRPSCLLHAVSYTRQIQAHFGLSHLLKHLELEQKEGTHIPIHRPSIHPHTPKPRGIKPRRLYIQRVNKAVDACVGSGPWRKEFREGVRVGGGEDETLGGGEEGRGRGGSGVVAC